MDYLKKELYDETDDYLGESFFRPVAAHLEGGKLVSAGDTLLMQVTKLNLRHMDVVATVTPKLGERSTRQLGETDSQVVSRGETLSEWVKRVEEATGTKIIGVTVAENAEKFDENNPKFDTYRIELQPDNSL